MDLTSIPLFVVLVCVTSPLGGGGQSVHDVMRLYGNLTRNYDARIRPVINQNETVQIDIAFNVISLQEFNDLTGVVTFLARTYMNWTEERMTWNPDDYGNLTTIMLKHSDVWTPKLLMLNAPDRDHLPGVNAGSVRVSHDGQVLLVCIDKLQTSCGVDVSEYPFDTQKCPISIIPWPFPSTDVSFNPVTSYGKGAFNPVFVKNSAWEIDMTVPVMSVIDEISVLNTMLTCTRRPTYTVLNLIIPMLTLAFLNTWVFLLPPESGERTSYSITVLLSFVLYMGILDDNIPKGSEPLSHLTKLLGFTLLYSVSLLFWTIISLRIYNNDDDKDVPKILQQFVPYFVFRCFNKVGNSDKNGANVSGKNTRIAEEIDNPLDDLNTLKASDSKPEQDMKRIKVTWKLIGKLFDFYVLLIHFGWWLILLVSVYRLSVQDE